MRYLVGTLGCDAVMLQMPTGPPCGLPDPMLLAETLRLEKIKGGYVGATQ
jgi:hypothetical protein